MPLNIIEGSRINYHQGLDTAHVHEIEDEMYDFFDGDETVIWDMGIPIVAGDWWVLSSITLGFDLYPLAPGLLLVDANAGAEVYWTTSVPQGPQPQGENNPQGPWKFLFRPAIKFPADTDFSITVLGTDASTIGLISWECWQENDISEV